MLFDDAPARKPPFWYAAYSYRASGPWPTRLLNYDRYVIIIESFLYVHISQYNPNVI